MPDNRTRVEINFSSLSVINDCLRKAQYSLILGYKSNVEAEATLFGKGIHKALEHWYQLPKTLRSLTDEENDLADTLIGQPLTEEFLKTARYETALESINEFVKVCQPLRWMADGDKRSIANGIKILKAYFKHYIDDGLEVVRDQHGPIIERECEFVIHEDEEKVVVFHGTIDVVLRSAISGQIFVSDHKTTASLGSQFYNRIKPNHQYTGYILAARECLGIETDAFMVNGIQVAKTKSEFARQPTQRNEEDFVEFKEAVIEAVERILHAQMVDKFPMSSPQACSNYGACQYLDVCSAPKVLRETILNSKYKTGN